MIQYDPKVIRIYAEKLYNIAFMLMIIGFLIGVGLGGTIGVAVSQPKPQGGLVMILAVVFGLIGLWIGSALGFGFKLKAQLALCQVQIEENTRIPSHTAQS